MLYSLLCVFFFFFKQKTAYEMLISDWSSDVCSSDLELFRADDATKSIIMIGEIGGDAEEQAAQFLIDEAKRGRKKPMAGFIAGRTAPPGRRMGHAGAIVSGGKGDAESKIAAMEAAGIKVSASPSELGTTLAEVLKEREHG